MDQFSVFTDKEKGNCIRTDMTSGAEVVRCVDKITYVDFFSYFIHDIKSIFVSVGMCNTDNLFFRFYKIITNQIDQSIQGCFTSTDIFISYNIAIFVSSENRLDFENISDSGY